MLGSPLLEPETWARCETDTLPERAGPFVLGADLGDGAAMSALAAYWLQTGRLECLAAFPEIPGLKARGLSDGVGSLYRDIAKDGGLIVTPGRAVDVGALLRRGLALWGRPVAVVADRYRETDLIGALEASGFPAAVFIRRGQGYKDGSEDVRGFRRAVLEDRVRAGRSLLLRAAFAEATTVSDPAGNEKLAKGCQGGRRQRARDDAAAAVVLAVAEGARRAKKRRDRPLRVAVAG